VSEVSLEARSPRVQLWTIQGAERSNSLRRALVQELAHKVAVADADRELRCVVITGAGDKAFCAGADLKERAGWTEGDVREWLELLKRAFRGIEVSPKVFVAALNGAALGGGLELALACDLRVADPAAMLGAPEVKLAIIPGAGGTQRLARVVGIGRAKDLVLTGRRVPGPEALAMGLCSKLSAPGKTVEEALALAEEIAENGPAALAQAKRAIVDGFGMDIERALDLEIQHYHRLLGTRDRLEGLAAWAEKRKPRYTGD